MLALSYGAPGRSLGLRGIRCGVLVRWHAPSLVNIRNFLPLFVSYGKRSSVGESNDVRDLVVLLFVTPPPATRGRLKGIAKFGSTNSVHTSQQIASPSPPPITVE
jgi:hypothetical protein